MSTPSFSAIKMLGDMLVEQEQRINDANPETDEQLQQDLEDVKELWKHYQFLMIDPIKDAVYKHSFNIRDWVLDQVADADLELSPKQVDYLANQPWPFPTSLMIGCRGWALDTEIEIDPNEIVDAIWVSREDMMSVMAREHPTIKAPRRGSIAQYIIENWLGDRWK